LDNFLNLGDHRLGFYFMPARNRSDREFRFVHDFRSDASVVMVLV
jgi:hypothetical protein